MVFIFGYDMPLIEFFVVITASILLLASGIIYILRRLFLMNQKLDKLLGEEKIFHKELAMTKTEEDKQLDLMRKIVVSMSNLTKISLEENKKLGDIKKRTMQQIRTVEKGTKHAVHLNKIVDILEELDDINAKENDQLKFIKDLAEELKKPKTRRILKKLNIFKKK